VAWTAPKTFAANSTLTAADLNTYLRDNSLETEPAKALTPGSMFVATGVNSIAERSPVSAFIATSETYTTTSTYGSLATVGPSVTAVTGTRALVFLYCQMLHSSSGRAFMSYEVSGATTFAASNTVAIATAGTGGQRLGAVILHDTLNAGTNTFTAKYTIGDAGTGTFSSRKLVVLPF
jgi:hypothetical protein